MTRTTKQTRLVSFSDLRPEQQHHLRLCVHEAGHAIAGAVLGGRVAFSILTDGKHQGPGGQTQFDGALPPGTEETVALAGPWAEQRFALGRRPTLHEAHAAPFGCRDRKALAASAGGVMAVDQRLPNLMERCWPAVVKLAQHLHRTAEARHDDVLRALGLTETTAPTGLALIRSGSAPRAFTVTPATA